MRLAERDFFSGQGSIIYKRGLLKLEYPRRKVARRSLGLASGGVEGLPDVGAMFSLSSWLRLPTEKLRVLPDRRA